MDRKPSSGALRTSSHIACRTPSSSHASCHQVRSAVKRGSLGGAFGKGTGR